MTYDQALDLAIDLLCSMQLETARRLCQEVGAQLDDDPWFSLVDALAGFMAGEGAAEAVLRAEQRFGARRSSVLAEVNEDGPRLRRIGQAAAGTLRRVTGHAHVVQPTALHGPGSLQLGEGCQLGYARSPRFAGGTGYVDCRHPDGVIAIGARTVLNNDFSLVSESEEGIRIGADCLIGVGVTVLDTDGHGLAPEHRHGSYAAKAPVVIEDEVWLGDGVLVLKGVTIGRGSVVAARSVVSRDVPPGTVAAGTPARPVGSVHP